MQKFKRSFMKTSLVAAAVNHSLSLWPQHKHILSKQGLWKKA